MKTFSWIKKYEAMPGIYKNESITYSHLSILKNIFVSKGWITEEMINKRSIRLKITPKGERIREGCEIIIRELR